MKISLILIFSIASALVCEGRVFKSWTENEMFEASDLVAIVQPISTVETSEKASVSEKSPSYPGVGLSSTLKIRVVMKGEKQIDTIVLHHYRLEKGSGEIINGPNLVTFRPKEKKRYLVFLKREADGRYAPVTGQMDPAVLSVIGLEGHAY